MALNDWFEWNGKRCTDFGIHVSEHPALTIPAERATYTNVPGRSGNMTTVEGDDVYDDMVLTATCWLADPSQIPTFAAWLKGAGKVTFANRPGGWYEARIANQISFDQILRGNPHRTFAVNFRCKSFWYLANVQPITLDTPLMEAYTGTTSQNCKMTGEFPVLKPGANAVSWTGSVTKVEIKPNWRTL